MRAAGCAALLPSFSMHWQDHIDTDPAVLRGKPVVRGTRLAVDFLLGLFAAGWSKEKVLANYPNLSDEQLRAVFAYAAEVAEEEALHRVSRGVA